MTINYNIIGKRIQEVRKRKKVSQEKLAELIDKSTSYISYIETAKRHMSLVTLIEIANALDISTDYLLSSNLTYRPEDKDEFSKLLKDCSTYEKRIIVETAKGLKQALRNEPQHSSFSR